MFHWVIFFGCVGPTTDGTSTLELWCKTLSGEKRRLGEFSPDALVSDVIAVMRDRLEDPFDLSMNYRISCGGKPISVDEFEMPISDFGVVSGSVFNLDGRMRGGGIQGQQRHRRRAPFRDVNVNVRQPCPPQQNQNVTAPAILPALSQPLAAAPAGPTNGTSMPRRNRPQMQGRPIVRNIPVTLPIDAYPGQPITFVDPSSHLVYNGTVPFDGIPGMVVNFSVEPPDVSLPVPSIATGVCPPPLPPPPPRELYERNAASRQTHPQAFADQDRLNQKKMQSSNVPSRPTPQFLTSCADQHDFSTGSTVQPKRESPLHRAKIRTTFKRSIRKIKKSTVRKGKKKEEKRKATAEVLYEWFIDPLKRNRANYLRDKFGEDGYKRHWKNRATKFAIEVKNSGFDIDAKREEYHNGAVQIAETVRKHLGVGDAPSSSPDKSSPSLTRLPKRQCRKPSPAQNDPLASPTNEEDDFESPLDVTMTSEVHPCELEGRFDEHAAPGVEDEEYEDPPECLDPDPRGRRKGETFEENDYKVAYRVLMQWWDSKESANRYFDDHPKLNKASAYRYISTTYVRGEKLIVAHRRKEKDKGNVPDRSEVKAALKDAMGIRQEVRDTKRKELHQSNSTLTDDQRELCASLIGALSKMGHPMTTPAARIFINRFSSMVNDEGEYEKKPAKSTIDAIINRSNKIIKKGKASKVDVARAQKASNQTRREWFHKLHSAHKMLHSWGFFPDDWTDWSKVDPKCKWNMDELASDTAAKYPKCFADAEYLANGKRLTLIEELGDNKRQHFHVTIALFSSANGKSPVWIPLCEHDSFISNLRYINEFLFTVQSFFVNRGI